MYLSLSKYVIFEHYNILCALIFYFYYCVFSEFIHIFPVLTVHASFMFKNLVHSKKQNVMLQRYITISGKKCKQPNCSIHHQDTTCCPENTSKIGSPHNASTMTTINCRQEYVMCTSAQLKSEKFNSLRVDICKNATFSPFNFPFTDRRDTAGSEFEITS